MITTKHGSIFDSTADVLVCPVNCVGVMGAGLAMEFKRRFPMTYDWYRSQCQKGNMLPGSVLGHDGKLLAATKDHWCNPSTNMWVQMCLMNIADRGALGHFDSIAIPQLGCGCGGLDWADVWPLYEKHLGDLDADVEVWIYE